VDLNGARDAEIEGLIDRVRHGDRTAIEQLFARHRSRLRQMVAVRMDDRLAVRIDPSDVVQEALAVASQRLPEYARNPPLAFYPWLRQIAWNCLVDLHRRHVLTGKRSVDREAPPGLSDTSMAVLADQLVADGTSPLGRLLREELRARVRAVLARLSPEDREIVLLRHLEQLSMAECAEVLRISQSAATQRQLRALERLRRLLDREIRGDSR
jgi:RNA polymerase sigma-70 factor (ECF subfamily)